MATNKINVSDLDFDLIKANLKDFLKGQTQFTDYDFEGSGLNVLLDVLAYNTHYNALYTNMAINEMFLDSASKRDSVVSIANNYGYLPVSRTAAQAKISLTIPIGSNTSSTLSLPKYSAFTSTINGIDYAFYTTSESIGSRNEYAGTYVYDSITLYEGTPVIERFNLYDNTKIQLQNQNIDVSTIRVTVQDPTSLNSKVYDYSEKIINLTSTSTVFFIKEIESQMYEVYFGNDNLGVQPSVGSLVTVEYIVTNGSEANGLKLFTYNGLSLGGTPIITVLATATGGREAETVDEIKYNVSHKYKVQDRAVTANDYIDIIKTNYSNIDAINCWGGDTMTPPIYGKIYISIKPKTSLFLTTSEKNYIVEEIVKPKSMLGIFPQMIDPIYNFIDMTTTVYYNPNLTNKSSSQIVDLVRQSILDYNNTNLQSFDGVLRYSRLVAAIDNSDNSIINNITTYKIRRNLDVVYNLSSSYTVQLNNAIYHSGVAEEAVMTNGFYINSDTTKSYYIDDDGNGKLRLFYYNPLDYSKVFINSAIGTVDYVTGELKVSSLFVTGIVESSFQFIIKPQSDDILSKHNQIVDIDMALLNITVIQEVNSNNHKLASSRI